MLRTTIDRSECGKYPFPPTSRRAQAKIPSKADGLRTNTPGRPVMGYHMVASQRCLIGSFLESTAARKGSQSSYRSLSIEASVKRGLDRSYSTQFYAELEKHLVDRVSFP